MFAWIQEPLMMVFLMVWEPPSTLATSFLTIEEIKEIDSREKWFTQSHMAELEQEPGSVGPFFELWGFQSVSGWAYYSIGKERLWYFLK